MTWKELPVEIQERMLEEQVLQGNEKNENVFINQIRAGRPTGGFSWDLAKQGEPFWCDILDKSKVDTFYKKYPIFPVRWCIKLDNQEVVDYCNKYGAIPPYTIDKDAYAHFPSFDGCTASQYIKEEYTEITLTQFKENILKQKIMQQLARKALIKAYKQFDCGTWRDEILKIISSKPLAEDNTLIDIPNFTLDLINQSATTDQRDYIKSLGIKLEEDKNAFIKMDVETLNKFSKEYLGDITALSVGDESVKNIRPDLKNRCLVVNKDFNITLIRCPNGKTAIEITKQ